jgi:acyl carrier protein
MTGELTDAVKARIGGRPLASESGLRLFDRVCATDEPAVVATPIDGPMLRAGARAGVLAPLFSSLVNIPARRSQEADAFAKRLAAAPPQERQGLVLELVRSQVATVLGHDSLEAIKPDLAFQELGFDSLSAVELRNWLSQASGRKLPATLVFDHPNSLAVATYLLELMVGEENSGTALEQELDRLEAALRSIAPSMAERERIDARLRSLAKLSLNGRAERDSSASDRIKSASFEEIFDVIDAELEKR